MAQPAQERSSRDGCSELCKEKTQGFQGLAYKANRRKRECFKSVGGFSVKLTLTLLSDRPSDCGVSMRGDSPDWRFAVSNLYQSQTTESDKKKRTEKARTGSGQRQGGGCGGSGRSEVRPDKVIGTGRVSAPLIVAATPPPFILRLF